MQAGNPQVSPTSIKAQSTIKNFKLGSSFAPYPQAVLNAIDASKKAFAVRKAQLKNPATLEQAAEIYAQAWANAMGPKMKNHPNAAASILRFLNRSGADFTDGSFFLDMVNNSPLASRCMTLDLDLFLEAAESLSQGVSGQIWISTVSEVARSASLGSPSSRRCGNVTAADQRSLQAQDWSYAVGEYRTLSEGPVILTYEFSQLDGFVARFDAIMYYSIRDFYSFTREALGGFVKNADMNKLHAWGMARDYSMLGTVKATLSWYLGDRFA